MLKHQFSDFSYAVNTDSAKKGYKEILVCYIYNGVEVLRKVYIPEGPGISYIFEARKIIDKEIKDGTLSSYSYRFIRRNKKRRIKPRKIVAAVNEGKSLAAAEGFMGFTYAVKPSTNLRKKFVEVSYNYNGEKVIRTLKLRGKATDDYVAKAKDKIKDEIESGFLEKYSEKYLKEKALLNSTPTRTPVVRSGFTGKTVAAICVVAALVITGATLGVYFGTRNNNPDTPEPIGTFSVTYNLVGCSKVEGPDTIEYGKVFHCTVQLDDQANTKIQSPYAIMSGKALSPTEYDWISTTDGKYEINIENVTGDILLYFVAGPNDPSLHYITWYDNDGRCKIEGISGGQPVSEIAPGGTFECNITALDQANYVSQIYFILMNGRKLVQGSDFTFSNGHLVIPNVNGNVLIVYNAMLDDHIGELEVDFKSDYTAKILGVKTNPTNGITKDKIEKIVVDRDIVNPLDGYSYHVTEIGYGAFNGCSNLKELTIPFVGGHEDQEYHSGDANEHPWLFGYIFGSAFFEGCGMITWQDFYDTDNVSEEVTAHHFMEPASIPISLESVTVTGGVTLKDGAFSQCKYIENVVLQDPINTNSDNAIGRFAFYCCAGLKNISINTTKTTDIGSRAFQDCTSLMTIDLTNIINIQHHAFFGCNSIHNVYLPITVNRVETGAFFGVYNGLVVCAKTKAQTETSWALDWIDEESPVVYDSPSKPIDHVDNNWHFYLVNDGSANVSCAFIIEYLGNAKDELIIIPRTVSADGTSYNVRHIGTYTFIDYIYTKKFVFESDANNPHPVLTIGHYAFENCKGLETIEGLNNSNLQSIGSYAFASCEKLSITDDIDASTPAPTTFPTCLEEIGNYSFYNCCKIQTLDITGVKKIGDSGFEGCCYHEINALTGELEYFKKDGEMLTGIRISNSAESFGARCFAYCCGLKGVSFIEPFAMTAYDVIPDYCFAYTDLQQIGFPSTTTSVGLYSFAYCSANTLILDGATSLKTISDGAFFGCAALAGDISLPSTIEIIGDSVFEECSSINSLDLSACSNITKIPYALSYNCIKMKSFKFPKSNGNHITKEIGSYAFGGCILMESLDGITGDTQYLPSTMEYVGDRAFMDCVSIKEMNINNQSGVLDFGVNVFAGWSSGAGIVFKAQNLYLENNCFDTVPGPTSLAGDTKWGWHITRSNILEWFHCAACGSDTLDIQRP